MLIRNATLPDGRQRDVRVRGESIAEVGRDLDASDQHVIEATGKRLFPGMIDAHVHFRQPGYPHKETWESGSRSAAAGGVTTIVDQPNTDPPTIDGESFDQKAEFAADSVVDWGINGGVTADWIPNVLLRRRLFALGEVFLADSTGDMGIESDLFADALEAATDNDVPVTVHAEDADYFNDDAKARDDADAWSAFRTAKAEAEAVERACTVAKEHDATIHIAHTSTPEGVDIASEAEMTTEVTPHHLLLSRRDLSELGTFGRMNPPLRREKRRQKLYERVVDGTVDMIATDHAPHTREEKDASIWDAPSGVPGVETVLPLLLAEARDPDSGLTYERVRDLTARNPADVFDLPQKGAIEAGKDADLVLVDTTETSEISGAALHSKCDWTPFEGYDAVFPEWTMVRGAVVYERGDALDAADTTAQEDVFYDHQGENVRGADSERLE
ncbi:dihydroorotase [Haloarcula argentinensis]|uniref:Dihydroorotase n=1 Tax=Haloarcula argentinensis TaxID=43776 RepID=A0ABU2F326_HALAR|nr:dihydroorotase [Haloarcula argentinensis]EMA20152.1 dihydroorotase [Haloarcula argentinensis DSM 12282]MDS0254565.1 dihydroorotase [Haloarcula argentinensis]